MKRSQNPALYPTLVAGVMRYEGIDNPGRSDILAYTRKVIGLSPHYTRQKRMDVRGAVMKQEMKMVDSCLTQDAYSRYVESELKSRLDRDGVDAVLDWVADEVDHDWLTVDTAQRIRSLVDDA